MKHIFQLQLGYNVVTCKVDAYILQVGHIVFVGQDKDGQRVFHVQLDVTRVEKLQKSWKHADTHWVFN